MIKRDIIVTWPKDRPLQSYLDELARAEAEGLEINYRVARAPSWPVGAWNAHRPPRCYVVHDGQVRGYNEVLAAEWRQNQKVRAVGGGYWPQGWCIVRDPAWYPTVPIAMKGFQGWRWFDEGEAIATASRSRTVSPIR